MRVLYIGSTIRPDLTKNNAYFEFLALKKIYRNIELLNCEKFFVMPYITRRIFYHISPKIFEPFLNNFILSKINNKYDLIYVNSSSAAYIGKKLILNLKKKTNKIVVLLVDNPFVNRDKNRWKLYLDAAKYYDLTATYYQSRITLGKKHGIKKILLLPPPYQKNIHCKQKLTKKEKNKLSSEIVVIGTWFPERGIFLKKLIDYGLNIKIYGNRWNKDVNYSSIKSNITLGHVDHPMYSKIIQSAKISICFPSEENMDGATRRSIEIPAIGTFLLAKNTREHKKYFKEGKEAVFFKNEKDCFKKCIYYLRNKKQRIKIARSGFIKVTKILKANYLSTTQTFIKSINFQLK